VDRLKRHVRRSRTASVLLLLTAVVFLFGWRIARDSGIREADQATREAGRLFLAWRGQAPAEAPPAVSADEAANRASVILGRPVPVPRGEGFTFAGTTAERAGNRRAAAVRFLAGGEAYLLLAVPRDGVLGGSRKAPSSPFPGASFLSGERGGVSFVLWKRDGLVCCLVSDRELTRVFEVVRRHFP
jgi:hypothetical protein